tara:strand:+ start:328 stop:549 length:222 start_codon:yes stop_codon:yes gene_type:complete
MSRDNIIIIAKYDYKYYVIPNLNMNMFEYNDFIKNLIINNNLKYTRNRGKALRIAHDIQKKIDTEYGVQEYSI